MHKKVSALSSISLVLFILVTYSNGQRITTIQLDGVQYFVSRMNPYSPELNYFLAYQYCRSLGLQLVSFETREKADSISQYLSNAGYDKYDFWTSGNKMGTDMFLWMSTGLPFNATFNYMHKYNDSSDDTNADIPSGSTSPQRTARESDSGSSNGCVALKSPTFEWDTDDCMKIKDFICEQTRCYYYNYGSIPVSSAQGKVTPTPTSTTTARPYTSSKLTLGYNDLINKLRSSHVAAASASQHTLGDADKDDVYGHPVAVLPHGGSDSELSTNGPYDSFRGVELQDDPSAYADQQRNNNNNNNNRPEEDYVSTIEPETVTIYERSFKSVH